MRHDSGGARRRGVAREAALGSLLGKNIVAQECEIRAPLGLPTDDGLALGRASFCGLLALELGSCGFYELSRRLAYCVLFNNSNVARLWPMLCVLALAPSLVHSYSLSER